MDKIIVYLAIHLELIIENIINKNHIMKTKLSIPFFVILLKILFSSPLFGYNIEANIQEPSALSSSSIMFSPVLKD